MKKILVTVTGHGFGHAMQTCLVVQALAHQWPGAEFIFASSAPQAFFRSRLTMPFTLRPASGEVGMIMHDAITVDASASLRAYQAFHHNWDVRVDALAAQYRQDDFDLLLSNVDYLPLAAAQRAGIPTVALCSLNWADIFRHYCPSATTIHAQIHQAYCQAAQFLQPQPHMPMADLPNRQAIAPLAMLGRRRNLLSQLGLPPGTRLVLIALGGFDLAIPLQDWPHRLGLFWLHPPEWPVARADCLGWKHLGLPFIDVLASCDALVTKPGYGTFTEAACNGVPVLYTARPDWPEAPYLQTWLARHGCCLEISRQDLCNGQVEDALRALWHQPAPSLPVPCGAEQAAQAIASTIMQSC